MTNEIMTVHEDLVGMGVDVESDEYYNEIDKRMKENFPHRFSVSEQRKPVQKVASAGRTQQGRKSVRLTKSQVAIAKKLGVPLEEYAKYVKEVYSMSDNKNRTSRASEEQKDLRMKPWTPPSSLDAPPAPGGYVHRWIRTESMGYQDTANVSKKMREGWEFVRAEEIKNKLGDHGYPIIAQGTYAGLIGVAGPCVGKDT